MKNSLVLMLAGALVGALAWGSCNAGRASDATKQLQAALAARADSSHRWTLQRDSLTDVLHALRADSATLEARRHAARRFATDSIGKLLAQIQDTSNRRVADSAVSVVYLEVEACQDQLANCEQRAQNAEQRARGDSVTLARTQALLDTVRLRWTIAERKAQPSFFRDLWRSRSVTLPLAAITTLLLLRR
jgi:hypothetical protein